MNNRVNQQQEFPAGLPDEYSVKVQKYEMFSQEANQVREKDKRLIRELFKSFSNSYLMVGIGFQRAYGSILSGDYFDLLRLPENKFLFVFSDISGHGLPAYTTLIRLRSAVILAVKDAETEYEKTGIVDCSRIINNISAKFTDIMDMSCSNDFASANFVFIEDGDECIKLRFFNRSMLFPIIVRREPGGAKIINLNSGFDYWKPEKGYLLGSDIKSLIDKDTYYNTPECCFEIYQGDMILFYTDGITEAFDYRTDNSQYGEKRLEQKLLEMCDLPPQLVINSIFDSVYDFIGSHEHQKDDMTAVLIDLPPLD
ncbi:MAG TPA: PP2C family protein-serine/threonine phosphatase [Spirochaetota bacterium]|nr:PP2C family protein-serine/threonine phosphatase [Spirochaetota bacterium]